MTTRVLLLGAVLALGLAACGGSSDPADSATRSARPQPIGDVRDLSGAGLHELPHPPTPLAWDTARVWTGDQLVIWGGVEAENDSAPGRVITDGASLDLTDGRWTSLAPSPFPEGLYHPLAAFDGTEVIIIGTQCEGDVPAATDGSPPACPKGPAAAAWNPGTAAWRTLPDPPIPLDGYSEERVINGGSATAPGDGAAVFAFGYDVFTVTWERAQERWTTVDPPWSDGTAVGVQSDPVEGRLVAIQWDPRGGPPESGPTPVWTLGAGEIEWRSEGTPELGGDLELDTAADRSLVSWSYAPDTGTVGRILDLATGASTSVEPDPAPGELLTVQALGEWIFARPSGPAGDPTAARVRRVDRDGWRATELPAEWTGEIYVGEGVIGSTPDPGASLELWRPPGDLAQ